MAKVDFKSLDDKALNKEILELKKELFNLKLNVSSMQVKDYSSFKKLRRQVAQAFTELKGRDNG